MPRRTRGKTPTRPDSRRTRTRSIRRRFRDLAVGYNPLARIVDGMEWLKTEEQKREDTAGKPRSRPP